jgi:hypothetical protein
MSMSFAVLNRAFASNSLTMLACAIHFVALSALLGHLCLSPSRSHVWTMQAGILTFILSAVNAWGMNDSTPYATFRDIVVVSGVFILTSLGPVLWARKRCLTRPSEHLRNLGRHEPRPQFTIAAILWVTVATACTLAGLSSPTISDQVIFGMSFALIPISIITAIHLRASFLVEAPLLGGTYIVAAYLPARFIPGIVTGFIWYTAAIVIMASVPWLKVLLRLETRS